MEGNHNSTQQSSPGEFKESTRTFTIPHALVPFLAGGIAGTCAKTAIAPLERVKILYQIRSIHYPFEGIFRTLWSIKEKEGVVALWKGNLATVVRIFPYAAVQFFAYENFKKLFTQNNQNKHSNLANLAAGSLAGASSVICTYPLDLVRVRLAVAVRTKHFNGIWDCISSVWKKEGIVGLYRGMSPTLLGIIPYAGVNFATYEALKTLVSGGKDSQLPVTVKLACGGLAGAFGQTVAYPLDVVRRQMQTAGYTEGHGVFHKNTIQAIRTILQKDGIIGLFRGMSINYVRVGPQVAISFTVYETVKKFLDPVANSAIK